MQNCFLPSVLTPYTLSGGEWRQRQNGLYIDFSGDDFSVYTHVNLHDVFLTFIYMQIYMQALLKTPVNQLGITALHLFKEKCCGENSYHFNNPINNMGLTWVVFEKRVSLIKEPPTNYLWTS